ncbi:MAG TPA: Cof-type HAD-IIB family hydrolase [Verrucomicrobiae bacterium]|jgi:Cof subfamily protein (haloacid dehalogenase superfamily)|nr:Cof-type HAD-IIB family hydrolase [Verrucomicrobiae bacterium]
MPVRLIALDIDGTLLDERSRLPEINRDAVAEAASRGIEIALVTGRRYDFATPIARQFPCPLTMIVNNGALVKSSAGETYLVHLLDRGIAGRVLDAATGFRDLASVCFNRASKDQVIYEHIDWQDPLRGAYFERNREYLAEMNPLRDCLTEDPIQVMFTGYANQVREVESFLSELPFASEYSLAMTVYDHRDFGLVDVIAAGCSKGATLAEWVRRRGWSREDVMAIGDNLNDLEMLQFAGLPVVMGNSVPELKNLGWRETLSNDQGGVAAAIARYAYGDV